tara:strand:- start:2483 stop:2695 length:213 start_codon:yes stop_codon:yes gene_type:complete
MVKRAKVIKNSWYGCWGSNNKGFPTFAIIVLALGVLWFLSGIGVLTSKIPWFPAILIILALGWIINHYRK